jgi:ribonuclease D
LEDLMLKYAREDTHYLLFIYDMQREALIEKGLATHMNKSSQVV